MTEQETAVRWLEQGYDQELELVTKETEHDGESVTHFCGRIRLSSRGLMFKLKEQNG